MTGAAAWLAAALADRYRIDRELGKGGMSTVYLAHDLRHDRPVAVKVLRAEIAEAIGPERFLAEIKTTARLQHPHILAMFDSGQVGGRVFYVMPYVEGESLRDRLDREGQLPVEDAIGIARDVAGALEYAHARGVIHRDIKPENILLHGGHALVADFGIALAASAAGGTRLTDTGVTLGTPAYMSPEQAAGERVLTARSDIYALGVTLYEMLAGEPPFTGPTAQAVMAKAMTDRPAPVRRLRETVPEAVEAALAKALQKIPADRFATAARFAEALTAGGGAGVARPRSARLPRPALTVGLTALVLAAAGGGAMAALRLGERRPTPVTGRFVVPLLAGQLLAQVPHAFAISRDGTRLAYVGDQGGQTALFLRPLNDFNARALPGTEGAAAPFFSPDGEWVGYFARGKLWKVPSDGGAPIALADAPAGAGGASWGPDGTILFSSGGPIVRRVPEGGGDPVLIRVERDTASPSPRGGADLGDLRWPAFLPDGEHALVSNTQMIGVLTLRTGRLRPVLAGQQGRYLPTGHLLYHEAEGRMRIVPFDRRKLAVTGEAVPAFDAFRGPGGPAGALYAVSETGTLVYVPGGFNRTLVLVDRNGRETPVPVEPRGYRFPAFSPDGRLVAVTVDPRPSSIWVVDLARARARRVTTLDRHYIKAIWDREGSRLAFFGGGLVWTRWPDAGPPEPVLAAPVAPFSVSPGSWAPDGRIVAMTFGSEYDLITVDFGDTAVAPLLATPAREQEPQLSPDGRWLAFRSDLSGADEIYVRPYPGPGADELVSAGGGVEPVWSADGTELFYRRGFRIMAVGVRTRPRFEVTGRPRELFTGSFDFSQGENWDVGPDGRFVMVRGDPSASGQLVVTVNWFEELRAGRARSHRR